MSFVPPENLEEDSTRDLERFLRVIDEPLQLLLYDIDRFSDILDIDLVDNSDLDALLAHLGNPFSFAVSLSDDEKRRLASVLVEAYKKKGTESGLENLVNYVLGITIDIQPAKDVSGQWILGTGKLGSTTVLGPGLSYLLYSFDVEVTAPITGLTAQQRLRLIEMIEWGKPSHTHFNNLIEPGGTITGP
jgi:phage tail-like protein